MGVHEKKEEVSNGFMDIFQEPGREKDKSPRRAEMALDFDDFGFSNKNIQKKTKPESKERNEPEGNGPLEDPFEDPFTDPFDDPFKETAQDTVKIPKSTKKDPKEPATDDFFNFDEPNPKKKAKKTEENSFATNDPFAEEMSEQLPSNIKNKIKRVESFTRNSETVSKIAQAGGESARKQVRTLRQGEQAIGAGQREALERVKTLEEQLRSEQERSAKLEQDKQELNRKLQFMKKSLKTQSKESFQKRMLMKVMGLQEQVQEVRGSAEVCKNMLDYNTKLRQIMARIREHRDKLLGENESLRTEKHQLETANSGFQKLISEQRNERVELIEKQLKEGSLGMAESRTFGKADKKGLSQLARLVRAIKAEKDQLVADVSLLKMSMRKEINRSFQEMQTRLLQVKNRGRKVQNERATLSNEKADLEQKVAQLEEFGRRNTTKIKEIEKTNEDLMNIIENSNEGEKKKVT